MSAYSRRRFRSARRQARARRASTNPTNTTTTPSPPSCIVGAVCMTTLHLHEGPGMTSAQANAGSNDTDDTTAARAVATKRGESFMATSLNTPKVPLACDSVNGHLRT